MSTVPFRYLHHLVTVPVLVAGTETTFVLDSGIGLTLVSSSLAAAIGCELTGSTYTGRRMSGQQVTIPLGSLDSLTVGTHRRADIVVGVFDIAGLEGVEGFLSLDYFRSTPLTIDYRAGVVVLEDADTMAARAEMGVPVAVRLEQDAHSTSAFLPFQVTGHGPISVEVDMGSDSLILNRALAADLGVDLSAAKTRCAQGRDETGHDYTRHFTQINGRVSVAGAPAIGQDDPEVMFQEIIYDGLVGDAFLRNFTVTFDLRGSRMIFAFPQNCEPGRIQRA